MYTSYFQQLLPALQDTQIPRHLYSKPNTPDRKLTGALDSYAHILEAQPHQIWFLYDSTFWGGAQDGFVITSDLHLYGSTSSHNLRFHIPLLALMIRVDPNDERANLFVDGAEVLYGSMETCRWF